MKSALPCCCIPLYKDTETSKVHRAEIRLNNPVHTAAQSILNNFAITAPLAIFIIVSNLILKPPLNFTLLPHAYKRNYYRAVQFLTSFAFPPLSLKHQQIAW